MEPPVRIVEIEGRGRALIAARAIKPGEIVLSELPLLVYPAVPNSPPHHHCFNCFRSLSSFIACASCEAAFCSPACKSSHHTWLCAAVRSLPSQLYSEELLFSAAHFLIAAFSLPPSAFQTLLSLISSSVAAAVATDGTERRKVGALCSILSALPPPPCGVPAVSADLVAALLAFDKRNAFGLMEPVPPVDGERRVRAYAIYPTASLFNHDCLPNACRFDYLDAAVESKSERSNATMTVRAIHEIPAGREVCISYFPVNWGYRERQRRLLEDYGFVCRCDRCEVEKNWKDNEGEDGDAMQDDVEEEEEEGDNDVEELDGMEDDDADFPHAYFFVTFVCDRENCGGTLAPLPPSDDGIPSDVLECNFCGRLRKQDDVGGPSETD